MGVDGVDNMTQEEYRRAAVDAVPNFLRTWEFQPI